MAFKYTNGTPSNQELDELTAINDFQWSQFNNPITKIGDISIPVELKYGVKKTDTVQINMADADIQAKYDKAVAELHVLFDRRTRGENVENEIGEKDREIGLYNSAKQYNHKNVTISILGEHSNGKITLYMDNIGNNINLLISTYVHEMMHAYYATTNCVKEVEEAIVEYSTLCFLEAYKVTHDYFTPAYDDVKRKKALLGASYYGFGAYLFDSKKWNWLGLYKGLTKDLNKETPLIDTYRDYFNLYPFGIENQAEEDLHTLLTNGVSSVSSSTTPSTASASSSAKKYGIIDTSTIPWKSIGTVVGHCAMVHQILEILAKKYDSSVLLNLYGKIKDYSGTHSREYAMAAQKANKDPQTTGNAIKCRDGVNIYCNNQWDPEKIAELIRQLSTNGEEVIPIFI